MANLYFSLNESDKDMIDFTNSDSEVVLRIEIGKKSNESNMVSCTVHES